MEKRKVPTSMGDYLKSLKDVRQVLEWIRHEVMNELSTKYLKVMIGFSFFVILFQSLLPVGLGKIISGIPAQSKQTVLIGFILTPMCLIIQKICERIMARAREWILGIHWGNMYRRMEELFFGKSCGQHIQETSLSVSGIDKGMSNLFGLQTLFFFEAVPSVIQLTTSLFLLFFFSIVSGEMMLLAVLLYLFYSVYLNFQTMKVMAPVDASIRKLNRRRSERMENVIRVKISFQEKREVEETTEWFNREIKKDRNFWLWFIEQATWRSFVNIFFFVLVLAYGIHRAWHDPKYLSVLLPLLLWSLRIIENMWQLGNIEQKINWALPSVRSMIKALSIPADIVDVSDAIVLCPNTPQRIVLNDISHSYPTSEKSDVQDEDEDEEDVKEMEDEEAEDGEVSHTLKHISFSIEPGEKVALIGPSGAGKTTLMRLLLRFMDPLHGSIFVGGVDLRHITISSWMKSIGYIAQHPEVLDGTIRDNLTYCLSSEDRANMTDDDLWSLMRSLEIDFGKRLDKGLDTKVGKHGMKLSGGQAQRLLIGAAVIGKPWFMVIDEATSSLDSVTEQKVQRGLEKILSGNTSALIIAHRLSTVRHLCTKFVVLKASDEVTNGDSQVEAVGYSFEELYKTSETFRKSADAQGLHIL